VIRPPYKRVTGNAVPQQILAKRVLKPNPLILFFDRLEIFLPQLSIVFVETDRLRNYLFSIDRDRLLPVASILIGPGQRSPFIEADSDPLQLLDQPAHLRDSVLALVDPDIPENIR
jgi:hypothetical protein